MKRGDFFEKKFNYCNKSQNFTNSAPFMHLFFGDSFLYNSFKNAPSAESERRFDTYDTLLKSFVLPIFTSAFFCLPYQAICF